MFLFRGEIATPKLFQSLAKSRMLKLAALAAGSWKFWCGTALAAGAAVVGTILLLKALLGAESNDEGRPYYRLTDSAGIGRRVLLMNRDTNPACPVDRQGYSDTATTQNSYWERVETKSISLYKLKDVYHSILWVKNATDGNPERTWELINCRHGNTYPTSASAALATYQNYLPFSTTSYSIDNRLLKAARGTSGQIVMQNTNGAQVVSSCYPEGIGTVYFDAVNAFTYYRVGKLALDVAYGVWAVEEGTGRIAEPRKMELDAKGNPVPPDDAHCDEIVTTANPDGSVTVRTNAYGRCAWISATMTGRYWHETSETDPTPTMSEITTTDTLQLALPTVYKIKSGNWWAPDAGRNDYFYRVWAPIQDESVNPALAPYCRGPMRFRIKRLDSSSENVAYGGRMPAGDLDGTGLTAESTKKWNGLLLIDNVIASYPAMSVTAAAMGNHPRGQSGVDVIGWANVLTNLQPESASKPIIMVGATGWKAQAGVKAVTNAPPVELTDPSTWIDSARMHYRWRYLNQQLSVGDDRPLTDWPFVELTEPVPGGVRSTGDFPVPEREGDVEFWFEAVNNAPYYSYVDFSGTVSGRLPKDFGYSERILSTTSALGEDELERVIADCGYVGGLPSRGTHYFFRTHWYDSGMYWKARLETRRAGIVGAAVTSTPFELVTNGQWRAFLDVNTNVTGAVEREFRIVAEGLSSTNYLALAGGIDEFPLLGGKLVPVGEGGAWSTFTAKGESGHLMFQFDDRDNGLSVVRAEYQSFDIWTDANKGRMGIDPGVYFVGTSTATSTNGSTAAVSSLKKTFPAPIADWPKSQAVNSNYWYETFGGITTENDLYKPFASALTPQKWQSGHGQWVHQTYKYAIADKNAGGVALQMKGLGEGYVNFTGVDSAELPRGIESVSFRARCGQDLAFDDFTTYKGQLDFEMSDYTFFGYCTFSTNYNAKAKRHDGSKNLGLEGDDFSGQGTLSVMAYYQPDIGGYEFRMVRTADFKIRVELWRWALNGQGQLVATQMNGTNGKPWSQEISWGYGSFTPCAKANANAKPLFMPFLIAVKTDADRTWVQAAFKNQRLDLTPSVTPANTYPNKDNWYLCSFNDTSADRLTAGTFGVATKDCPGRFVRLYEIKGNIPAQHSDWGDATKYKEQVNWQNNKTGWAWRDEDLPIDNLQTSVQQGRWTLRAARMIKVDETESARFEFWGFRAKTPSQKLIVQRADPGSSNWATLPDGEIPIDGFSTSDDITVPVYESRDSAVRILTGGDQGSLRTDVVIDNICIRQWRGETRSARVEDFACNEMWYAADGLLLQGKRVSSKDLACGIRAPLMDGATDERGIGAGMISFNYRGATAATRLLVQVATNDVGSMGLDNLMSRAVDPKWETFRTVEFSDDPDEIADGKFPLASGTVGTYFGWHGVKVVMRVILDPACVEAAIASGDPDLVKVTLTGMTAQDEPEVDESSWWGWNMRTLGDSQDFEQRLQIGDMVTSVAAQPGLAGALNNSYTEDIDPLIPAEQYRRNLPFVQSPTIRRGVTIGEFRFKARKYDATDPNPSKLTLYGSSAGNQDDPAAWQPIRTIEVDSDVYRPYAIRFDGNNSFNAYRLAVQGVPDTGHRADTPRILLDDVQVVEAMSAALGFRNIHMFRTAMDTDLFIAPGKLIGSDLVGVDWASEQPLWKEGWGVQVEIFKKALPEEIRESAGYKVLLSYYVGMDTWGWDNWRKLPYGEGHPAPAELVKASDAADGMTFRSSYIVPASVVTPATEAPTVVQYMLQAVFTDLSGTERTNTLSSGEWKLSEVAPWYYPVDHNAGRNKAFSPFAIIDSVSPGRAWINEVNVYDGIGAGYERLGEKNQYVEVAVPIGQDLAGWHVDYVPETLSSTNQMFKFGADGVAATKTEHETSKYAFMAVQSPKTRDAGGVKYADGSPDDGKASDSGTWNATTPGSSEAILDDSTPFVLQLVRKSGVIEHEIVALGTNGWAGTRYEKEHDPTNLVNKVKKAYPRASVVYAGTDCDLRSPTKSLSVVNSNGCLHADWTSDQACTPGWVNGSQTIPQGWAIFPNGSMILVIGKLGTGYLRYKIGDTVYTGDSLTALPKGETMEMTYFPDKWFEVGSVTVTSNGVTTAIEKDKSGGPVVGRTDPVTVVVGGSNDLTVVGRAQPEKRLREQYGLTDRNPYTPAVMKWLIDGRHLGVNGGGSWAGDDLADIRYITPNCSFVTNLTLTQCYCLDMDPTDPDWAFMAGTVLPPSPVFPKSWPHYDPAHDETNLTIGVMMCFTNTAAHEVRQVKTIRGLDYGTDSDSWSVDQSCNWTSQTFKVEGLLATGRSKDWLPLRWFVFDRYSFAGDAAAEIPPHYTVIEVDDPFGTASPGYSAGWYKYKDVYPVFFRWNISDKLMPIGVDILRPDSTYHHE